jgi:hypothetical protein
MLSQLSRVLLILICLLTNLPVYATSFYPQPFPSSVQDASNIVRGKVGMSYSEWGEDNDGKKRLFTFYEVQTTEALKGSQSGPTLVIRELGGEKDGVGLHVPGASHYERGEDVVVLLSDKNKDGSFDVQGMSMGKFNIQTDSQGEEYLVGIGISRVPPSNPGSTPNAEKWTLGALRNLIQSQAETSQVSSHDPQTKSAPPPSSSPPAPSPSPAPQLQPSQLENSNPPPSIVFYLGALIAVLGGVGFLWVSFRNRK